MNNKSGGMSTGAALLLTLAIMLLIGWLIGLSEPKCAMSGCKNEAKDGSRYCYLHDMSNRYYGNPDYNAVYKKSQEKAKENKENSTSSDSSNKTSSTDTKNNSSSSKKSSSTDSYDDGYDAVYDDGDYDWDRYQKDSDYANGVDDALEDWDEYGDDW